MREELTRAGVLELTDSVEVDQAFSDSAGKTQLVVINSVCGCAAANARPAVILSKQASVQPDEYLTVFAGQDLEATARVRERLVGIPPSSPFIALMKDAQPVFVLERRHIEGRSASAIAMDLVGAYEQHCAAGADGASTANGEANGASGDSATDERKSQSPDRGENLPPTFKSIL